MDIGELYSAVNDGASSFNSAQITEGLTSADLTYAQCAIKTSMNDQIASSMLAATNTAMDEPKVVVAEIIKAIETNKHEHYIGQPQSFLVWFNGFY